MTEEIRRLDLTEEDVKALAEAITVTIVRHNIGVKELLGSLLEVDLKDIVKEELEVLGLTDPIGQVSQWIIDRVKEFVTWIGSVIRQALEEVGKVISGALSELGRKFAGALEQASQIIIDWIKKAKTWIEEGLKQFCEGLATVLDTISQGVKSLFDKLEELGKIVLDPLKQLMDMAANFINQVKDFILTFPQRAGEIVDQIRKWLEGVWAEVQKVVGPAIEGLRRIGEQIWNFLQNLPNYIRQAIDTLWKTVQDIGGKIGSALGQLVNTITDFLTKKLPGMIVELPDKIRQGIEAAINTLGGILDKIRRGLENLGSTLWDILTRKLPSMIQDLSTRFTRVFEELRSRLTALPELIKRAVDGVLGFIDTVRRNLEGVFTTVRNFLRQLPDQARKIIEAIPDAVKDVVDKVTGLIKEITKALPDIPDIVKRIIGQLTQLVDQIVNTVKNISKYLETAYNYVKKVMEEVSRAPNIVKDILDKLSQIPQIISDILSKLPQLLDEARKKAEEFIKGLPQWITEKAPEVIKNVESFVWQHLPNWVKSFLTEAPKALQMIAKTFEGYVNALVQLPSRLYEKFKDVPEALKDIKDKFKDLVEALKDPSKLVETLLDKLRQYVGGFVDFILDAVKGLGKKAREFIGSLLTSIGGVLRHGIGFLADLLLGLLDWLVELMKAVGAKVASVADKVLTRLADFLVPLHVKPVLGFLKTPEKAKESLKTVYELVFGNITRLGFPKLEKAYPDLIEKYNFRPNLLWVELLGYGTIALLGSSFVKAMYDAIKSAAEAEVEGAPAGLGVRFKIAFGKLLDSIVKPIVDNMEAIIKYTFIGFAIWATEPFKHVIKAVTRYFLPYELPSITETRDIVRRALATKQGPSLYREGRFWLALRGISEPLIDILLSPSEFAEKFYAENIKPEDVEKYLVIAVKDRFEKPRMIPLYFVYSMPTPSEVTRMMVRDLFANVDEFAKVMKAHGYYKDLAYMYYMFHFKYPSMTNIWEFIARGIAGELWFDASKVIDPTTNKPLIEVAKSEAEKLGAYVPKSPRDLNFKYDALLNALVRYAKWQDYALFAWIKDFTSDNFMMIDVVVDIPTKIDFRWMSRWGLFDYWGALGIEVKQSIIEITRRLLPPNKRLQAKPWIEKYVAELAQPRITMDVRQFARMLQATGLHPYWVPWVSIAETINALTEERTLLRTGFINLFREGALTKQELDKLLAGFFTVVFKTAYFDLDAKDWVETEIEYPVAFLPAESKLLELRAVMDRAVDLLRDYMRAIGHGVRQLVYAPEKAIEKAKKFLEEKLGPWFKNIVKTITGKELELKLDEAYEKLLLEVYAAESEVESIIRSRVYARYALWSIIGILRRGFISPDKAKKDIEELMNLMMESETAKQLFIKTIDIVYEMYRNEILAEAILNKLRSRRITVEEARKKLTQYGIPEDLVDAFIESRVRFYTPSLTTYATLLEVVPEAVDKVAEWIKRFNLPGDEAAYWLLYVRRKPDISEYNLVRTRIYQLLSVGAKPEEVINLLKSYMAGYVLRNGAIKLVLGPKARELERLYEANKETLQAYGIDKIEFIMYNLIGEMEKLRAKLRGELREYVPTPSMLAAIAEVVPEAVKLMDKVFEERNVPEEWRPIWEKYIKTRPVVDEIRRLITAAITAYARGAIGSQELDQVFGLARKYGWTDEEIAILKAVAETRRRYVEFVEAAREYIPTPAQLAVIAEYVPEAAKLADKVFEERNVPEEWRPIWKRYIAVRPLADELRRLLTTAITVYARGYLTDQEFEKLLEFFKNAGWTDTELKIIKEIASLRRLYFEAREEERQYIPTPAQLATIAEVVPEAVKLIDKVFEARRVPEEWRPIWRKYVTLRPVYDELRRLVTDALRVYAQGLVDDRELQQLFNFLKQYGWTDAEILVLKRSAELRKALVAAREYIPTPMQLATLFEYVPEIRDQLQSLLKRRNVPDELIPVYINYIIRRAYRDDARRLLTAALRARVLGLLRNEDWRKLLEFFKKLGFDDQEIDILNKYVEIEALIEQLREYIPTPTQMATIVEYVPEAKRLLSQVLEARRVPEEWRKFWELYVDRRVIASEARRLWREIENNFVYGYMSLDELKKYLQQASYGMLTSSELDIIVRVARSRRARRLLQQLYASIREYSRLYRYADEALDYMDDVIKRLSEGVPVERREVERVKGFWKKVARNRALLGMARRLLTELINAYAYYLIDDATFMREAEALKQYGIKDEEIQLALRIAQYRRARYTLIYGFGYY